MYSAARERRLSHETDYCSTLAQRLCKKSQKQNTSKSKPRDNRYMQKDYEEKVENNEVIGIVKSIQRVNRFLPLVLTSAHAYEPGRIDCNTCNADQEAYRKMMRTLNMVDILASRAIEKEQTDMLAQTELRRQEEKSPERPKEDRISIGVGVFREQRVPHHSLKCILINLQNHLAYLIIQIGYMKTRGRENEARFKNINVSVEDLQAVRFQCTALTEKVITLLKGPAAAGAGSNVGICVGCAKQELAACNEQLERILSTGGDLVLVMRNDRPGRCCQRGYAHIHAQAHGFPIVLKYHQEHTTSDSDDDPHNPHRESFSSYKSYIPCSKIQRDVEEYSNLLEAGPAKTGGYDQFDEQQSDIHSSYRKQSILSRTENREYNNLHDKLMSQSEPEPKELDVSIYDDPDTTAVCNSDSSHKASLLSGSIPNNTLHKNSAPQKSESADPSSATLSQSSHSKSNVSSPIMYVHEEHELADLQTVKLHTLTSHRKSSANKNLEPDKEDELRNLSQDTLSSLKTSQKSIDQNKPCNSVDILLKVESHKIQNAEHQLRDLSEDPHNDILSSQKSDEQSRSHDSAKSFKVGSVMIKNSNDKSTITTKSRPDMSRTHSSHSRLSTLRSSGRKSSMTESTEDSLSESSFSTGYSNEPSEEGSVDTDKREHGKRQPRISHVSFKETVTEASFHDSGSFPSYLQEQKDDQGHSDSEEKHNAQREKEDGPFANKGEASIYMVAMDSIILNKQKMSLASMKGSKQRMYDPQPPDTAVFNAYKYFLDQPEYETKVIEPKRRADGGNKNDTAKRKKPLTETKKPTKEKKVPSEKAEIKTINTVNENNQTENENEQNDDENNIPENEKKETKKKDTKHQTENNKIENILDFFGRDRLLNVMQPAECCLQMELEKESVETSNIPLRPSLDSLPLSGNDLIFLAQRLGMEFDPDKFTLVAEDEAKEQVREWERKLEKHKSAEDDTKWQRAVVREEAKAAAKGRQSDLQPSMPTIKEEPSICSLRQNAEVKQRTFHLPLAPSIPSAPTDDKRKYLRNKTPLSVEKKRTTELRYFTVEFPLNNGGKGKALAESSRTADLVTGKNHQTVSEFCETDWSVEKFHLSYSSLSMLDLEASKLADTCRSLRAVNEMIMFNTIYLDTFKDDDCELKYVWKTPLGRFPKLYEKRLEQEMSENRLINLKKNLGDPLKNDNIEKGHDTLSTYDMSNSTLKEMEKGNKLLIPSESDRKEITDLYIPNIVTFKLFDEEAISTKYYASIKNRQKPQSLDEKTLISDENIKEKVITQRLVLNKSYTIFKGQHENDFINMMKNEQSRQATNKRNNINLKRPCRIDANKHIRIYSNDRNQNEIHIKKAKIESLLPPISKQQKLNINNSIRGVSEKGKISNWPRSRINHLNAGNYIVQNKGHPPKKNKNNKTFKNISENNREKKPLVLRHSCIKVWRFEYHVPLPVMKFTILKPLLSNIQLPVIVYREQQKTNQTHAFETTNKSVEASEIKSQRNNIIITITDGTVGEKNSAGAQKVPEPRKGLRSIHMDLLKGHKINCNAFNSRDRWSTLIMANPVKAEAEQQFLTKSMDCSDRGSHGWFLGEYETRPLDRTGRPLFDSKGQPLTDRSGRVLRDAGGRAMAACDQAGGLVSDRNGGPVHDSHGRALGEAEFDPTKPNTSETRILKTLMSPTGEPQRLYDGRGRPLTSASGTVLTDATGRTLITFKPNGQPHSDSSGGPLYDAHGHWILA